MKRKLMTAGAGLVALALLFAPAIVAQESTSTMTGMDGMATGKVTAIDTTANTVTVDTSGGSVTYRTDSGSRYYARDGRSVELATLRVGDPVTVHFSGSTGNQVVSRIDVTAEEDYRRAATADSETPTVAENRLPATASSLPLVGLVGLLLIGGALAIRVGIRFLS
jgi:hypothetical protein